MISEDDVLERAYELHPELLSWRLKDYDRAEAQDGVNWRLHLHIDASVFRRVSDPSLPDGQVIERLQAKGPSRQDAIHMIARIIAEGLWELMQVPSAEGADRLPESLAQDPSVLGAPGSDLLNRKISALVDS